MKWEYELEFITPVHVGTGRKLYPFEYVVDKNRLVAVDMDRLLGNEEFLRQGITPEEISRGRFSLGERYPQAKDFPRYALSADAATCRLLREKKGEVQELISDAAGWYIPGSSLKGALRTLTYKGNDGEDLRQIWEEKIAASLQDKKTRKEFLASQAEKEATGDPHRSLFRALLISDSTAVGEKGVGLYAAWVMARRQSGWGWKILPHGYARDEREATPLFFAAFRPGEKVAGTLIFQEAYLKNPVVELKKKEYFSDLWQKVRKAVAQVVAKELAFFRETGFAPGEEFYVGLKDLCAQLKENEIIFPLGWGTGYDSKTYREGITQELWLKVAERFDFKRTEGLPFPKTRKIVLREGKPWAPPGWVRMTLR
ncbi:MAG: CRISPR-associated protein Csm5 [Eubacteriales bacterium]|nr:CRISPR-associated protein Csm5 [Eubacteriales bacterium]